MAIVPKTLPVLSHLIGLIQVLYEKENSAHCTCTIIYMVGFGAQEIFVSTTHFSLLGHLL